MRNTLPNYALEFEAPRSRASTLMALWESADPVMVSCNHSEPRFPALPAFARPDAFAHRVALLDGHDHADLGKVRWNG